MCLVRRHHTRGPNSFKVNKYSEPNVKGDKYDKYKKEHRILPRIWADGSCFNKVIPTLQAEGYEVMSAQYGLDTNESDVATVKRTLGRIRSPAILVGHSYGGSVIRAAGTNDRIAGLSISPHSPRTPARPRRVT